MIEIKNLKKTFQNPETKIDQTILAIPSYEFKKGEKYALFGPSGIGKTTLLHIISGLLTPDSGELLVNGVNVASLTEADRDQYRAKNIGYIFQSFNLLDGFTALENVMLGMLFTGQGTDKSKAVAALTKVGLADRLHYMPSQLSVGQQQRVSVARAIVNDPEIILADEPTGNLDPATSNDILALLFEQSKDKTLIVVTHEEHVLNQFDHKVDMLSFIPQPTN
ncbi:MAG TPA: ABC transporter ATP-binding protein [Bacteroidetes bacterium]|nr:ABC transporter ATP-binding protein [Bacteroidota bacterium]